MKKITISAVLAVTLFISCTFSVSAQNLTLAQLIELFISIGVIAPDKVATARALVANQALVQANTLAITRTLSFGMSGADVKSLQEFLSKYPDVYPEKLVTGYYGNLTVAAVKKFQIKYGITSDASGTFGAKTLAKAQEVSKSVATNTTTQASTTALTVVSNPLSVTTNPAVSYSGGGGGGGGGSSSSGSSSSGGGGGGSTPDTTPPVISNVQLTGVGRHTVTVTWSSNETSIGQVIYSNSSSFTTSSIGNTVSGENRASMNDLSENRTYYFYVRVTDTSGNSTNSSVYSFTTLQWTPEISNIDVGTIGDVFKAFGWDTSTNTSSGIVYSTSSSLSNPIRVDSLEPSMSHHSVTLTNLTPLTTYYYVITATNRAGSIGSSTLASFTTTAPDTTPPDFDSIAFYSDEQINDNWPDKYFRFSWHSNEEVLWSIYFGTTYPVDISSATKMYVDDGWSQFVNGELDFMVNPDPLYGELAYNDTYYFVLAHRDRAGNWATSTSLSYTFTVGNPPDVTPPTISNLQVVNNNPTNVDISWDTADESIVSDASVCYGTSIDYLVTCVNFISPTGSAPNYNFSVNLSNLSPNTTYYYGINLDDERHNDTYSTSTFTTL